MRHALLPADPDDEQLARGWTLLSPREAIYVLDGLLENDTILRPREHYTDTHGLHRAALRALPHVIPSGTYHFDRAAKRHPNG